MNAILSLWTAIANLARSLNRLAAATDAIAEEGERRVELVTHQLPALPPLEGPHANGEAAKVAARSRSNRGELARG